MICQVCSRRKCTQRHTNDDFRWAKQQARKAEIVRGFKEGRLDNKYINAVKKSKVTKKDTLSPKALNELTKDEI